MVPRINENLAYRPEIDGLRALAVIPVIFFHAGFELMSGGFVGVDVFFVISGYLITAILYREIQAETFTLGRFYERRIRRLYPALTLMTFVSLPFAWLWMMPHDFRQFLHSMAAIQVFGSNIYFWQELDYFSTAAELTPLLHTWSLAVEEQFYLLFPFALLLLKPLRRQALLVVVGLAVLGGLLLAEYSSTRYPNASFFLLHTRAWELLTGSFLALAMQHWKPAKHWSGEVLAWSGVVMIGLSMILFHGGTPFPGLLALLPVGGTALIIAFARQGTSVARVLSLKPMVFIGLVSYSAYLWHQPIFAFARIRFPWQLDTSTYFNLIFLTFVVAYLSWRFIELPFRHGMKIRRRALLTGTAMASVALFVSAAGASLFPQPILMLEKRLEPEQLRALELVEAARKRTEIDQDRPCVFRKDELDEKVRARLLDCFAQHGSGVAVLGDSHGRNVFNGLAGATDRPFLFGFTQSGCMPHPSREWCLFDEFLELLEEHDQMFQAVLYNQAGFALLQTRRGREVTRTHLTEARNHSFKDNPQYIESVVDYLAALARHTPVIWLGPWTEPHLLPRELVMHGCDDPPPFSRGVRQSFEQLDDTLETTAGEASGIEYVSSNERLGLRSGSRLIDCRNVYFHDGDHWSLAGEERFGKILHAMLDDMLPRSQPD